MFLGWTFHKSCAAMPPLTITENLSAMDAAVNPLESVAVIDALSALYKVMLMAEELTPLVN